MWRGDHAAKRTRQKSAERDHGAERGCARGAEQALKRSGGSRDAEALIKSFAAPRAVAAPSLERQTAQRALRRPIGALVAKAPTPRAKRRFALLCPVGGKAVKELRPNRTTVNGQGLESAEC